MLTEKRKAYQSEWRRKNSDKIKLYSKRYKERTKKNLIKWRAENRGRAAELQKNWVENNKSKAFDIELKKYGIDSKIYQEMHDSQSGVCSICERKDEKRRLSVDHCHDSGFVRGLLCSSCNILLGYFEKGKIPDKIRFAKYLMENG